MSLLLAASSTAHSFSTGGTWNGSRNLIVTGWWNPSSFVANRYFWIAGSGVSLGTGSSTSGSVECRITRGTSDAICTSGANVLVANDWNFIAVSVSQDSSGVATVRIWFGDADTPPRLVSGATSNGLGSITNATSISIGSSAACVSSNVSDFLCVSLPTGQGTVAPSNSFLYDRFIYPIYSGSFDFQNMLTNTTDLVFSPASAAQTMLHVPCDIFDTSSGDTRAVGYIYTDDGTTPLTLVASAGSGTISFSEPNGVRQNRMFHSAPYLSPTSRR